jgi:hypothetical protein
MQQQEIKFFWPLTEQIPLDLDYSVCDKPKLSVSVDSPIFTVASNGSNITLSNSFVADNIEIEVGKINFTLNEKPSIIKRLVYKLLDISWKVK